MSLLQSPVLAPSSASICIPVPPIPTNLSFLCTFGSPLSTCSAPLSSPCHSCTDPVYGSRLFTGISLFSAARYQHSRGREASQSLPPCTKPPRAHWSEARELGEKSKTCFSSKEVLQDAPYPKLRLDSRKHPTSQRAALFGGEGEAATLHPRPAQIWGKRCHRDDERADTVAVSNRGRASS